MYPATTREGIIEIDRLMVEDLGIDVELMMEHAGLNLAKITVQYFYELTRIDTVIVVVGSGNNGGGGLVAARRLHNWNIPVVIFLPKGEPKRIIPEKQYQRAINCGVKELKTLADCNFSNSIVIDCYIGYNFHGELDGLSRSIIDQIQPSTIISLDIPSGIDIETGENKGKLNPIATVTLAWPKKGLLTQQKKFLGDVYLVDIGVPTWVYQNSKILTKPILKAQVIEIQKKFSSHSFVKINVSSSGWHFEE